LQFELANRFGQEEIDAKYTYLCNRGQNAVVTYKGARAHVAAALATQKQQMRMYVFVLLYYVFVLSTKVQIRKAQVAAALATQKQQMRMYVFVLLY
jgi:phosphoribosyl-ATP pyrophosphohydrolase